MTADRPATEPRTEDVDADECGHMALTRWTGGPGVDDIWACSDCRRRFYPACPQCVTVGHRNGHRAEAAQGAAPRAEGLDARTMKRAIINVICGWQDEEHCGRDADEIAAEYVRLSRPSDERVPEPRTYASPARGRTRSDRRARGERLTDAR